MSNQPKKKLTRSNNEKIIAGVCGGLGEFFGITPARFRLIFVLIALLYGAGLALYIVLWLLIPKAASENAQPKKPDQPNAS